MKRLVLISTFCDTQEKIDSFSENVDKFKNTGLDVMALGPNWLPIPDDIIKKCDFFFYTKENPIISYPIRKHTQWYIMPIGEDRQVVIHRSFDDYGWASLYQIKKLLQFGLTYDYDSYCVTIYDTVVTNEMIEKLLCEKNNILHKRLDPKHEGKLVDSAHFMIIDREKASLIENDIVYENYKKVNFAEDFPKKWSNEFNITYEEPHVTDKIYFWDNQSSIFDYEIHQDFKFFISKHPNETIIRGIRKEEYKDQLSADLRIVMYDFVNEDVRKNEMTVELNGVQFNFIPQPWAIVEFPMSSQGIETIKIYYKQEVIDFTEKYSKISFSQIYYNYDI